MGNSPGVLQTVIPDALRTEVLADLHEGTAGGHLGADKTLARLRERFYWPGHFNDVREWCQRCAACQSRKSPAPTARAPLQSIVTGRPLQLVATDIVGPLPESPAGNLYILVVADYFTRYVEAYPIPNQEATTVARKLVDEFFLRFSPPEQLHSDQGRNFESTVIAEICKLLGIEKSRTTPYHPQSDGLVERTLLDKLATAVTAQPFQWEQHLRRLCFAYNTSVHPTTGHSPFALMFGRQARLPMDIILGSTPSPAVSVPQYAAQLRKSLDISYASVPDQMANFRSRKSNMTQGHRGDRSRWETWYGCITQRCPGGGPRSSTDRGLGRTEWLHDWQKLSIVSGILDADQLCASTVSSRAQRIFGLPREAQRQAGLCHRAGMVPHHTLQWEAGLSS